MNLKKSLMLLITFGMISGMAVAEKPIVNVGDWYYKQFDYRRAIEYYKRALKKDAKNNHVLQKIADSYRLLNDWATAEGYYATLVQDEKSDVMDKLYYAEALRANQKYAEAKIYYKAYTDAAPNDNSVKERLQGIDKVEQLSKDAGKQRRRFLRH